MDYRQKFVLMEGVLSSIRVDGPRTRLMLVDHALARPFDAGGWQRLLEKLPHLGPFSQHLCKQRAQKRAFHGVSTQVLRSGAHKLQLLKLACGVQCLE